MAEKVLRGALDDESRRFVEKILDQDRKHLDQFQTQVSQLLKSN